MRGTRGKMGVGAPTVQPSVRRYQEPVHRSAIGDDNTVGHLFHQTLETLESGTNGVESTKQVVFGSTTADMVGQLPILLFEVQTLGEPTHHDLNLTKRKRFGQIVGRSKSNRLDRGIERGVSSNNDDLHVGVGGSGRTQHGQAVSARHDDVGHHQPVPTRFSFKRRNRRAPIGGRGHGKLQVPKKLHQQFADVSVIVNDKYLKRTVDRLLPRHNSCLSRVLNVVIGRDTNSSNLLFTMAHYA